MKARFFNNCVNWKRDDVHAPGGLCAMIDSAKRITRKTFLKRVDSASRAEVERSLGYAPHDPSAILTMARDFCVSYYKSTLHGQTVYFLTHSAIEYVFKP